MSGKMITLQTDCAERLDVFAAALADVTRSRIESLLKDGCVAVNGVCFRVMALLKDVGAAVILEDNRKKGGMA